MRAGRSMTALYPFDPPIQFDFLPRGLTGKYDHAYTNIVRLTGTEILRKKKERPMNDHRHKLTREVQELICNFVRAGGFPHVAAVAAGIPLKTFQSWLRCGKARRPQPLYLAFYEALCQAQAIARLAAETQALRRAPLSWLRYGPGRERGRLPGWTDPVKPAKIERGPHPSVGRMQELVTTMLEALDAFPEARAALADSLEHLQWLREEYGEETLPAATDGEATSPSPEVVSAVDQDSNPDPQADAQPPVSEAQPAADQQAETPPEPAKNPQANDNPPATKAQPTDVEAAEKPQPTGSENASNQPSVDVKEAPKPPGDGRSWWDRIMAGPWTTVAVWRTG